MTPGKRNYLLLSLFDFLYLFAWSSTMAFFVIWTTQHLGISATKTGLLYSVNAFYRPADATFLRLYLRQVRPEKTAYLAAGRPAPAGGPLLYLCLRAAAGAQFLVRRAAGGSIWGSSLTPAAG